MKARKDARFVVRQEADRLQPRPLAISIAVVTIGGILGVVASTCILRSSESGRDLGPPAPAPAPAQIGTVESTLILANDRGIKLRAEQRASLDRYGWNDRDAGRARIPIERAMDLLVDGASSDGGVRP